MTTTALIGDDWQRSGIKVLWRFDREGQGRTFTNGTVFTTVVDNVEIDIDPLVLTDDMARALLTALIRHYDGGEDARSLRRDYDAERKRVDVFIAHLTGGAS
jgi:hypothetical protein